MSVVDPFLPAQDDLDRHDQHIFIRFMRKKYICITMLLFTITVVAQTIGLIISNIDKNILQHIDNTLSLPHNFTLSTTNMTVEGLLSILTNNSQLL